jgi:hypothetical protein
MTRTAERRSTTNTSRGATPSPEQPPTTPLDERPIAVELSRSQIQEIVRAASQRAGGGSLFAVLRESSRIDISAVARTNPKLSSSLLTGLAVLGVFPRDGSSLSNTEVARALNIGANTAYRYVATLRAVGLVRRDPSTRRYSSAL